MFAIAVATPAALADVVGVVVRAAADAPVPAASVEAALTGAGVGAGDTAVAEPDLRAGAVARIAAGAVPAPRLAGFERAAALAEAGWQAYLAVEPALAAERLEQARREAETVLDLSGGPALYADLCLRLGVVQAQRGHPDTGRELMRLAARLDPERELSIAVFAPDVVDAYRAARTDPAERVPTRLAVHLADAPVGVATYAEASAEITIEIDGQVVSTTPETLRPRAQASAGVPAFETTLALDAGPHLVVVRAAGHHSRAEVHDVGPGRGFITVTLASDPVQSAALAAAAPGAAPLAPGGVDADAAAQAQAWITYAELDALVLVASVWRRGGPALLGQRCGQPDGRLACGPVVEIGYDRPAGVTAAATELWSALAQAGLDLPGPTLLVDARVRDSRAPRPGTGTDPAAERGWRRSTWLWIGAGAVASALAAGTVWALTRDRPVVPVIAVDPCEFGPCERP
ncbi:hypothetical protein [Haliangium sp.]|uniref:hypothetical protein n=1 Tax=Haliangium sp. TaxID=2663208 RepID=UPI003D12631C